MHAGKMVAIQCFDGRKYFDKEMIEDGILSCIERGADPKAARLWYKLIDNKKIKVKINGSDPSDNGEWKQMLAKE